MAYNNQVIQKAQEIVMQPETEYSYVDVGDVLVDHLRGRITVDRALERLCDLETTYAQTRRNKHGLR